MKFWRCTTCKESYYKHCKNIHLRSNKHLRIFEEIFNEKCIYYDKLYRDLYPVYEDYKLCQIKGFFENMPYMTFLEFICKCELIRFHLKVRTFHKFPGEITMNEFVELSNDYIVSSTNFDFIERYDKYSSKDHLIM